MNAEPRSPDPCAQGLSRQEAARRLAEDGPNDIGQGSGRSLWTRLLDLLRQPMFSLLLAAALLYIALGDLTEGLTLSVFVLAVLVMTFYQEGKSEAAIAALQALSQPHAQVLREGRLLKVAAREVVTGDLLWLQEGDRIAADGWLLQCEQLQVDESLLTGESVPVHKQALTTPPPPMPALAGDEHRSAVFGSSFVVAGQGLARVSATGPRSQVGRIGQMLDAARQAQTPLQRQTSKLVKRLALVVLVLCSTLVLVQGLRSGQWMAALLSGIALAMAILPEEYPVVLTLFPALGARRLTQAGVLTRRLASLEALEAMSVLCSDKTGTLTENRMTVTALAVGSAQAPQLLSWSADVRPLLGEAFHPLIEHAILASAPVPFDPMESAFHALGREHLDARASPTLDRALVRTYALSAQLKAMSHVWSSGNGKDFTVSAKGAPEAVMDLCHLREEERTRWSATVEQMAAQGLRVLAVAQGRCAGAPWPDNAHDFSFEWVGLLGLTDPLREGIPGAVAECHSAGIRVIMITGDHPATAQVIARQAGLADGGILTGAEMDGLDETALRTRLSHVSVCARITPAQKLRIVQALQAMGETVGMTGDGVNDAPALRAAHVGIAMGLRGTDVAREAAALVLVDNRFTSIVQGIRLGRQIFDNLQKSMRYIFAVHIPIAGMALLPLTAGLPPLLLPMHVALLELIIDPACSIAFEKEPADARLMQRPPRQPDAPLLGRQVIAWSLVQGLCVLGVVVLSHAWAQSHQLRQDQARTMAFITLVLGNAVLIMVNRAAPGQLWRSFKVPNPTALVVITGALMLLLLCIHMPWLARALAFEPLGARAWFVASALALLGLAAVAALQQLAVAFGRR